MKTGVLFNTKNSYFKAQKLNLMLSFLSDSSQRRASLPSPERPNHVRGPRPQVRHTGHRLSMRHDLVLRGRSQDRNDFRKFSDETSKDSSRRRRRRFQTRSKQLWRRHCFSDH